MATTRKWGFSLCDGMGGQSAGELASSTAVETVLSFFRRKQHKAGCNTDPSTALSDCLKLANTRLRGIADGNPSAAGMGSTAVCVLVEGSRFWIGHVGDSRLYQMKGRAIEQLTRDHSIVAEYVRKGVLTEEEASKSNVNNVITRALGADDTLEPEVSCGQASPGDTLLLTSDGLTKYLQEHEIAAIINLSANLQQACAGLIEAAKQAGGDDNITCLLIRFTRGTGNHDGNGAIRKIPRTALQG